MSSKTPAPTNKPNTKPQGGRKAAPTAASLRSVGVAKDVVRQHVQTAVASAMAQAVPQMTRAVQKTIQTAAAQSTGTASARAMGGGANGPARRDADRVIKTMRSHTGNIGPNDLVSGGFGAPKATGDDCGLVGGFWSAQHAADGQSLIVTGRELVASVGPIAAPVGTILLHNKFNPKSYGPRLRGWARGFTKWEADYIEYHFKAGEAPVGVPANGLLNMGVDTNVLGRAPSNSEAGVQEMVEFGPRNNIEFPVWTCANIKPSLDLESQSPLFVEDDPSGDERLTFQAQMFLQAASDIDTTATPAALGNVLVTYRIRFSQPIATPDDSTLSLVCALPMTPIGPPTNSSTAQVDVLFSRTGETITQPSPPIARALMGTEPLIIAPDAAYGYDGDVDQFAVDDEGALIMPAGKWIMTTSDALFANQPTPANFTPNGGTLQSWNNRTSVSATGGGSLSFDSIGQTGLVGSFSSAAFAGALINGTTMAQLATHYGLVSSNSVLNFTSVLSCDTPIRIVHNSWFPPGTYTNGVTAATQCYIYSVLQLTRVSAAFDGEPAQPMRPAETSVAFGNLRRTEKCLESLWRYEIARRLTTAPVDCVEALTIAPMFLSRGQFQRRLAAFEVATRASTTPLVAPLVAAAISWFVSTYGKQLGEKALDWGIRRIQAALKPK